MNDTGDITLSLKELKTILRQSNSDRRTLKHLIERTINVPYGEPIKLQFQLNGMSDIGKRFLRTIKHDFLIRSDVDLDQCESYYDIVQYRRD